MAQFSTLGKKNHLIPKKKNEAVVDLRTPKQKIEKSMKKGHYIQQN